jgi:hypothetical protein
MNLCAHTGPYSGFDWWGWPWVPAAPQNAPRIRLSRRGGHLGQWPAHPPGPGAVCHES